MEIGHPPGNPTWQLLANVASHLGGSAEHAAVIINTLSAIEMALAACLLSGITYMLLRGSLMRGRGSRLRLWANICAGSSALCYAWCDSAIFSAVEAEVYALSALFTTLMLWLALRWAIKRSKREIAASRRILILMAYIAGLGVGVHELNFLILPAVLLIYIYGVKSYPLRSAEKRRLIPTAGGAKTLLWSMILFCVGTTTYLLIPIRGAANPPVNTFNPSTFERFMSYYRRDQYGSKPLLYGRTPYSQPLLLEREKADGTFDYSRYFLHENSSGKKEYVYPEELDMWLPRMTSADPADIEFYEAWAGMKTSEMTKVEVKTAADSAGRQVAKMNPITGERETQTRYRPTYLQQFRYLGGYQIGYMYFRYLLWNFSGRQNNVHSTGEKEHGNFLTGIAPIDDAMLGPQSKLPNELREKNPGYNRFFMIPLIVGIIGICALVRNGRRGRRVCLIITLFFIFTGLLIVVYLNQDPGEPRERDYSFLGSYMAYAIWIGCGMAAAAKLIMRIKFRKSAMRRLPAVAALLFCVAIPLQMLSQTYDDHNRSRRPGAEAVARKYLLDLPQDAIIMAYGDNVIFPLWYAQEVLGWRKDVSVVAVPYLSAEWYREQLLRPGEGSKAVNISVDIPEGKGPIKERLIKDIKEKNPDRPVVE